MFRRGRWKGMGSRGGGGEKIEGGECLGGDGGDG